MADVIAEGKEVAEVLQNAKENIGELLAAGQEKVEPLIEKGKGINLTFKVNALRIQSLRYSVHYH